MKRILITAALTLAILGRAALAEDCSSQTYVPLFTNDIERGIALLKSPPAGNDIAFARAMLFPAEEAYRVGKATGNKKYLDAALALYDLADSRDITVPMKDFHVAVCWGRLTYLLNRDGLLTGDRREKARVLADNAMKSFVGTPELRDTVTVCDWNIAMAFLVCDSAAAAAFPDDSYAADTRKKLAAILNLNLAQGDMKEESTNYEPLLIGYYLDLLHQENRVGDLTKNPRFHQMFERWRDFTSPGIFYPEIGDSYFDHEVINFGLICDLEQGARIFNDPSLATEAQRLMRWAVPGGDPKGELIRATALADLTPFHFDPTPSPACSLVNKRAVGQAPGDELWNWLILRTGTKPGDAMLMMDIYSANSHSHPARRAAIAYYEADGMPVFHNLGRRGAMSGNNGNVFWTENEFDSFPGLVRPNVWNTQVIPLDSLKKTEDGSYSLSGNMWFRTFASKKVNSVTFSNLRLEGDAGTKVIDDFSDRSLWVNFKNQPFQPDHPEWIQTVKDPVEGSGQKLLWEPITTKATMALCRALGKDANTTIEFKSCDYDCVKFDFKYDGDAPYANLRNWAGGLDIGCAALPCTVANATVKQLGSDGWGRVDYVGYMGSGSQLSRRMLLTKEGVLVVVDRYVPGKRSLNDTVGQLWQLYTLPEKGDDWFASSSDGPYPQVDGVARPERRMLVKYYKPAGALCAADESSPSLMNPYRIEDGQEIRYTSFWTTYCKAKLAGDGKPFTAVQVVYPLLKESNAQRVASGIQFTAVGDGEAELKVPTDANGSVEMTVSGEGAKIER